MDRAKGTGMDKDLFHIIAVPLNDIDQLIGRCAVKISVQIKMQGIAFMVVADREVGRQGILLSTDTK